MAQEIESKLESEEAALQRWADLEMLQQEYKEFGTFLVDVIEGFMGFNCTDLQLDIGDWISNGPQYRMVQAQRGQAKTTITAAYAVWRIIHDPTTRVLIISAGSDMATEIANWIIQIIRGMPELECLMPDRSAGDRASVSAFDVHHSLKGPEKSASVTCVGITSNLQGKRADVLIADDIESQKNSQTATQRARLHHLTLDFVSICSTGDIIWLGTPQSVDSIYNTLPSRGTAIRVWTGRYPTAKELPDYEGFLAPSIMAAIKANPSLQSGGGPTGERGQVTDPVLLNEAALTKKEIDQGASYFQLQHMLSTKLADADRYPLKLSLLRFCNFDLAERKAPMVLNFIRNDANKIVPPEGFGLKESMFRVQDASEFGLLNALHMYVDPSGGGQNGDEMAWAVTGYLAGRVFLVDVGGIPGGLGEFQLEFMTALARKWKPASISIEKNFGNGAFASVWTPRLQGPDGHKCGIEEVWESGQKELRIIDVLEPMIGAGKFVVLEDLLLQDHQSIQKYPGDKRQTYSFFWQLARITRDKKSLIHDDRLDAVAGSARAWVEHLSVDDLKAVAKAKAEQYAKMVNNPLGNGRALPMQKFQGWEEPNALTKHGLQAVGYTKHFGGFNGRINRT